MSLITLGRALSLLGRYEDEMAADAEAAQLYRRLAEADPDRHRADLATAVNNLAIGLARMERHEEARTAAEEATAYYRQLADINPAVHLLGLAASLNTLSLRLMALEQYPEATAASEEAVRIVRQLGAMGRSKEALAAAQETVDLYRDLAAGSPDVYRPGLASALANFAYIAARVRRNLVRAEQYGKEAILLFRDLAEQSPDAFVRQMIAAYRTQINVYDTMGREDDAATLRAWMRNGGSLPDPDDSR
jgi:tetratricopeptide (TPR) repeat protein